MNELVRHRSGDLILFATVVDAGGFSAAARVSNVPQATISRRIAELEADLNLRLLERSTRKISVTEIGKRVYEHACVIRAELDDTQLLAASMQDDPSGLVRLTAPVVFGQYFLASALSAFQLAYPRVTVHVRLTGRVVDLIDEEFDVAIRVGEPHSTTLIRNHLTKANAAYYAIPEIAEQIETPNDFKEFDWLHAGNESGPIEWKWLDRNSLEVEAKLRRTPRLTSSDVEILIASAEAGVGVAILPEFAATAGLRRILPNYVGRRVDINALVTSRRSINPSIRAFLNFMKAYFNEK